MIFVEMNTVIAFFWRTCRLPLGYFEIMADFHVCGWNKHMITLLRKFIGLSTQSPAEHLQYDLFCGYSEELSRRYDKNP